MASISYKFRPLAAHHQPLCTLIHLIGSLFLVLTTFFFIMLFLLFQSLQLLHNQVRLSQDILRVGLHSWPPRRYGSQLSLKIYVYNVEEIHGLKALMYGRDDKITEDSCLKAQLGTQIISFYLKPNGCFRLSGGRNLIFVFPRAGAHLFRSWATYINRSIILTPKIGDQTDKRDTSSFNTWKDIIIPGNVDDSMTKMEATAAQLLPLSKRKYLANYLGRAQGKAGRILLIEVAKQFPDKECVPVILSDQVELPFQKVLDHSQISIKWPSSRIDPQLLEYLESIPDIEALIAHGRRVRCLWVYASDSARCSAMRWIMWEPRRKVRQFHQSAETFWLHNGSIVNRNLIDFSKWEHPVPLS